MTNRRLQMPIIYGAGLCLLMKDSLRQFFALEAVRATV